MYRRLHKRGNLQGLKLHANSHQLMEYALSENFIQLTGKTLLSLTIMLGGDTFGSIRLSVHVFVTFVVNKICSILFFKNRYMCSKFSPVKILLEQKDFTAHINEDFVMGIATRGFLLLNQQNIVRV